MGMTLAKSVNNTLDFIQLHEIVIDQIYAENSQFVKLSITNKSKLELFDLQAHFKDQKHNIVSFQLRPLETLSLEIPIDLNHRGWFQLPRLIVSSSFPSGLFRAWKVLKQPDPILVYPSRTGKKDFPLNSIQMENSLGLIREIRDYRPGDSPKRIHWRSLAKNKQLRTLVHEGDEDKKCDFHWSDVSSMSTEAALSQLSLWLHQAEQLNYDWTLELPNKTHHGQKNPRNFHLAMSNLALWETSS